MDHVLDEKMDIALDVKMDSAMNCATFEARENLDSVSPSMALSWLQLLNAPENNHDSRAFTTEGPRMREYRQQQPNFSVAAVSWPRYAIQYWDILKTEVTKLFSHSETKHNFAQWVLEYARETNAQKYKFAPTAPRARKGLVLDIYAYAISPLHMAAILGLPDLTCDLAMNTAKDCPDGQFGSPLFCALMGPAVLETGTTPAQWSDVFNHTIDAHRLTTIRCLLTHISDHDSIHFTYSVKSSARIDLLDESFVCDLKNVTLAGLSFWAAASCNDLKLIEDMLPSVAKVDDNLLLFVVHAEEYLQSISKVSLSQAFTTLLDYSLGPYPVASLSHGSSLPVFLEEKMEALDLRTTFSPNTLNRIADCDFDLSVIASILYGKTFSLARLATDPRFDVNTLAGRNRHDGTIAHLAVAGNEMRIVQILIDAGSDFSRTDEEGRTPLLLFESLEMLELLVCKNGLSTSVTDEDGRNLWHFSGATNDGPLMNWLCENDRDKKTNIQAVTHRPRWSPLNEAIGFILTTKKESYSDDLVRPRVLPRLLKEMKMCNLRAPLDVNVHLAVSWGSLEVVEGLVAIGADFRGLDAEGNTVLHKLNFTATPALVRRLLAIVGSEAAAIRNHQDQLPAETIFTNTFEAYVKQAGQMRASRHPACASILDIDTFRRLLAGRPSRDLNRNGQGLWERISKLATGWLNETKKTLPSQFRDNFFKSVAVALQTLIEVGAMNAYEEEEERSALETLQLRYSGRTSWEPRKSSYLDFVIFHCRRALLKKFYTTKAAMILLIDAWWSRCFSLVGRLAKTGMPLHLRHSLFDGLSFVEMVLTQTEGDILSRLYGLLNKNAKKYFLAHTHIIYKVILQSTSPLRRQMLLMLLSKGLDPNPELAPDQPNHYLPLAIKADGFDLASLLLKFGADPASGRRGENAFIGAAAKMDLTLMADIISVLEDRRPAFTWDCEYENSQGITFNALQMAAYKAHDRMLLLLLQTPLRFCINHTSSCNMSTPAHLAAKGGSVESLQVLLSWGADMEIRDGEGLTPLEVALKGRHVKVVDFLRRMASS